MSGYVDGELAQITTSLDALAKLVANEYPFESPARAPGAVKV